MYLVAFLSKYSLVASISYVHVGQLDKLNLTEMFSVLLSDSVLLKSKYTKLPVFCQHHRESQGAYKWATENEVVTANYAADAAEGQSGWSFKANDSLVPETTWQWMEEFHAALQCKLVFCCVKKKITLILTEKKICSVPRLPPLPLKSLSKWTQTQKGCIGWSSSRSWRSFRHTGNEASWAAFYLCKRFWANWRNFL